MKVEYDEHLCQSMYSQRLQNRVFDLCNNNCFTVNSLILYAIQMNVLVESSNNKRNG